MNIYWTSSFKRGFKRTVNKYPTLHDGILSTIQELSKNPFSANLKTHKLKGDLEGTWASSIDYNLRIIFNLVKNPINQETDIILVKMAISLFY